MHGANKAILDPHKCSEIFHASKQRNIKKGIMVHKFLQNEYFLH